jgi:hypothetical protein
MRSNGMSRRHRQSARRHFRNGHRAAALRAITAGGLYLSKAAPSIAAAAERCGSNRLYVKAAIVLLQSENMTLRTNVLEGTTPLQGAAKAIKQLGALVHAYRRASAADRVAFAKTVGPTVLFDTSLVPAL